MGRRLGPSADEQRARLCTRACASCQWMRQFANYTGRLHPIADAGHHWLCVGEGANVCGEEYKKESEEIVFYVAVVQKQESNREKHSVFFATCPFQSPPLGPSSHNNPRVVYRAPAVGAVVWFRQDR